MTTFFIFQAFAAESCFPLYTAALPSNTEHVDHGEGKLSDVPGDGDLIRAGSALRTTVCSRSPCLIYYTPDRTRFVLHFPDRRPNNTAGVPRHPLSLCTSVYLVHTYDTYYGGR